MAYRVEFSKKAERELAKLPLDVQKQLAPIIDALSDNPCPPGVKRLAATNRIYRVRSGEYRVLYQIRDDVLLVLVVRVAHRREAYRDLSDL
jgi:mRNA interferase RelE/StbE